MYGEQYLALCVSCAILPLWLVNCSSTTVISPRLDEAHQILAKTCYLGSATTNATAQLALAELKKLKGCELHITHIPTPGDEAGLKRLGINLTTDPNFSSGFFY